MAAKLPDGYTAIRDMEFVYRPNWLERLRLLCGRPLRVRQDFVYRGEIRDQELANVRMDAAPIGGRWPE